MDKLSEVKKVSRNTSTINIEEIKEYLEKEHSDVLKKIEETLGKQAGEGKEP